MKGTLGNVGCTCGVTNFTCEMKNILVNEGDACKMMNILVKWTIYSWNDKLFVDRWTYSWNNKLTRGMINLLVEWWVTYSWNNRFGCWCMSDLLELRRCLVTVILACGISGVLVEKLYACKLMNIFWEWDIFEYLNFGEIFSTRSPQNRS